MNARESRAYAEALGANLRAVRRELGLSLPRVEEKSGGHFKAVVVGSYERADRAVTVVRLAELAAFYGVPVAELLPTQTPTGQDQLVETRRLLRRLLAMTGEES